MITVTLYSRDDCHLCEQARADLDSLQERLPHTLVVVDVDSDDKLRREFGFEVPVVAVGPYRLKAPFGVQELHMTLAAAQDRERHIQLVEASPALEEVRRSAGWTRADRFNLWISKHYMTFFNSLVFIYLGAAFLAPVLMKGGATSQANVLYKVYSALCHQLGFRSFYLFGEQFYYPRFPGAEGVQTFTQATGLGALANPADLWAARQYVGNEQVGYKIALCQRDIGIYGGILVFGLLFSLTGRRFPPISWVVWVLVGIVPIAVDGFSQLFSQPPFSFLPFRESTYSLRLLTGFLFGFFTAWFAYPIVEQGMKETRQYLSAKYQRLHKSPVS